MIHEGRSREIDALGAATKLNRLANRPEILTNLHPGADTLDLTPLALAPHTFIAFYDDLNAALQGLINGSLTVDATDSQLQSDYDSGTAQYR